MSPKQLRIAGKARKQYEQACSKLRKNRTADVEKHVRRAVETSPEFSVAWVTLGQVLGLQQRTGEARDACSNALAADHTYLPAYLCLADLAARAQAWDEVLKLSTRALELDPAEDAIVYEYHAAAHLHLRNLVQAEKSALRAADIDKDHREPRIFFVLAQIYEAKGDQANEAVQLREYLKYAADPVDIAAVQKYLKTLEQQIGTVGRDEITAARKSDNSARRGPLDIDEVIPTVRSGIACPLPQILDEASRRTQDFIDNLQRFSANERIHQIHMGKDGKSHSDDTQIVNYVAQIEQNSAGFPAVKEYRYSASGVRRQSLLDTGTAAFALIFHPVHIGNFIFRCEGLSDLRGVPAWQLHFEENPHSNKSFHAIKIGKSIYLPRFKGRAWVTVDSYEVSRIETDLVSPVPEINWSASI